MIVPFSRRSRWNTAPNRLTEAIEERRHSGLPLIDLTSTAPSQVGLGPTSNELRSIVRTFDLAAYAPDPHGLSAAREAIARHHGHKVDPSRIFITASTSESYAQLFQLLCDPGDEVLVPVPSYPLFDFLAGLQSVTLVPYPTVYADGWHIDLDALTKAVTERTRAIVVVAPNNPTGALLRPHEREAIVQLCERHGLAIIADEVFADFALIGAPERVPSLAGEERALTFVLSGLSKACLAPGVKAGWILVSGPSSPVRDATARLEIINDTALSASTIAQSLIAPLLERSADLQAPVMRRLRDHRRMLKEALEGSTATLLESDGGWMAVLRVPIDPPEETRCLLLLQRGLLVHPGHYYDFPRAGHLVLSLLPDEASFRFGALALSRQTGP